MRTDALSSRPPPCPQATFPQTDRVVRLGETAVKRSSQPARTRPPTRHFKLGESPDASVWF